MWRRWVQNSGGSTEQRKVRGPRDVKRRDWTAGRCCWQLAACFAVLGGGGCVCAVQCAQKAVKKQSECRLQHSPFVRRSFLGNPKRRSFALPTGFTVLD